MNNYRIAHRKKMESTRFTTDKKNKINTYLRKLAKKISCITYPFCCADATSTGTWKSWLSNWHLPVSNETMLTLPSVFSPRIQVNRRQGFTWYSGIQEIGWKIKGRSLHLPFDVHIIASNLGKGTLSDLGQLLLSKPYHWIVVFVPSRKKIFYINKIFQ